MGSAVRRYWWLALLVSCGVVAAGVAAAYVPAKRFQASTTLLAQPATASDFNSTSIALIQFLLPAIPEQVKSQGFHAKLDSRLPVEMRNVDLSASVEPGTGVIRITANDRKPRTAALVANTAAATVVDERISPALNISILNPARIPTAPASPRKKEILAAAAVLAILAGIGAALVAAGIRGSSRPDGASEAIMSWQRYVAAQRLPD